MNVQVFWTITKQKLVNVQMSMFVIPAPAGQVGSVCHSGDTLGSRYLGSELKRWQEKLKSCNFSKMSKMIAAKTQTCRKQFRWTPDTSTAVWTGSVIFTAFAKNMKTPAFLWSPLVLTPRSQCWCRPKYWRATSDCSTGSWRKPPDSRKIRAITLCERKGSATSSSQLMRNWFDTC